MQNRPSTQSRNRYQQRPKEKINMQEWRNQIGERTDRGDENGWRRKRKTQEAKKINKDIDKEQ